MLFLAIVKYFSLGYLQLLQFIFGSFNLFPLRLFSAIVSFLAIVNYFSLGYL